MEEETPNPWAMLVGTLFVVAVTGLVASRLGEMKLCERFYDRARSVADSAFVAGACDVRRTY